MKIGDVVAVLYLGAISLYLVLSHEGFIQLTKTHPFIMGFIKVSCLATFGECLKNRLTAGSWRISKPVTRFLVWGIFGFWFTCAFPFAIGGTQALIAKGLWLDGGKLWTAFSSSLWICPLGGYAFTMMVTHEYFNKAIDRGRIISFRTFAECMTGPKEAGMWFKFIPLTIFLFWIPAHTITFLLPPEYYVLFAAALSIMLGFFVTLAKRRG